MNENYPNYHGGKVRVIFLIIGLLMLIGLPFFVSYLQFTLFAAIMGILIIGIFAGLTSHRNRFVMFLNILISIIGAFAFEYTAIGFKEIMNYFIFNQVIAILFFVAIYFSVKTFRDIYWTMR